MDRKNFSQRREQALYRIVHDEIMNIRISILRGDYDGISAKAREEIFCKSTRMLGDKVCAEYRRSYSKGGEK